MLRTVICVVALLGFSHFAPAGEPNETKSQPRGSQESASTSRDHYIPSSGLTLEALKNLPPRTSYNTMAYPIYQPYYYGGFYPYRYNAFYPYTFGPMNYGMGGYMPPGVNRYSSVGAVSFWVW